MIKQYPELALERFDKADWWIKYVNTKIKKFLKDDILEVGAGFGSFTKSYMKNFQSITLTDMDDNSFSLLKKNFKNYEKVKIVKSSVENINKTFNTILYFNVLEHIEEDTLEIESALKKLNTGGYLIILVPAHQKMYSKLDKAVGHFKRYDIDFFKKNQFKNAKTIKIQFLDILGHEMVGKIIKLGNLVKKDFEGNVLNVGDRIVWSMTVGC